jgi:hypothetical protein
MKAPGVETVYLNPGECKSLPTQTYKKKTRAVTNRVRLYGAKEAGHSGRLCQVFDKLGCQGNQIHTTSRGLGGGVWKPKVTQKARSMRCY